MKPTIKIENGCVEIHLTPENEFEKTMLKDMRYNGERFECRINREYATYSGESHSISLINVKAEAESKSN